jgi:hypothetical protein
MNMEENPSIWQDLEFPEICPAKQISKIEPEELEYTSNKKVINIKVVENFMPYDLESNIVQNGVLTRQICPDF